jgi:hypothetical protein
MFFQLDEHMHTRRRRIVGNMYSMANVLKYEVYIDACTEELLSLMEVKAASRESVALEDLFVRCVVNLSSFWPQLKLHAGTRGTLLENYSTASEWVLSEGNLTMRRYLVSLNTNLQM